MTMSPRALEWPVRGPPLTRGRRSIGLASAALVAVTALAAACGDGGTQPEPPQPNRAPVAQGSIANQTVPVGETVVVSVASAFSDPDGDGLTYAGASTAPSVARVTVSGANVTVTGVSAGTANVTVTASDPSGLSAQQGFQVTVPNRPPEVTDGIPDQTMQPGDTVLVNLAQHFSDPDGDELTYEGSSSNTAVARASVSSNMLTLAAVGSGTAKISVTASDPGGLSTSQDFGVTVAVPGVCGRTPQIRDGIVEAIGVSGCESVTAADLAGIRSLDFSSSGLKSLRKGDLDGLTALRFLSLGDNQLVSLPDGVFADLTSLEELVLSNNELVSLQPNVFSGLRNVYNLFLHGNNLASLDEGVFVGLHSLHWLVLSHNGLTSISNSPFSGLSSLNSLNLDNNELTSLPDSAFSDLAGLHLLYLQNNRLTSLPRGVFSGLAELNSLWLSSNQLESLPEGVFSGLHDLEGLLLEDNLLSSLPEGVFSDMSAQGISLGANQLTSLPEGVFSGLTDLQSLDLSGNQLESLPSGILSGLSSLQALVLTDNQLDSLPEGIFSGLPGFEFLWLDENPGAPFEFGLQFERIDGPNGAASPDSVRVVVAEGAPFDLRVPLSVQSGTLSASTALLPAGSTAGPVLSVMQGTAGRSTRLTAAGTPPDLGSNPAFEGFTIGWPAELVLFGSGMGWDVSIEQLVGAERPSGSFCMRCRLGIGQPVYRHAGRLPKHYGASAHRHLPPVEIKP